MTRKQFLNDLYLRLEALGQERAEQHLTYYAEMLADRMEEGMTEEEAVSGMEDLDTIVRRILEEEGVPETPRPVTPPAYPDASRIPGGGGKKAYQPPKRWTRRRILGTALWAVAALALVGAVGNYANDRRADRTIATEAVPIYEEAMEQALGDTPVADTGGESYYSAHQGDVMELQPDEVQSISIQCRDGSVRVEAWDGGTVQYSGVKGSMGWRLEGGQLVVQATGGKGSELLVQCPSGLLDYLEINTVSASVVVDYLDVNHLEVVTISGDMDLYSLYGETIDLTSTSGDLYLSGVQAGAVNLRNVSGDIDFYSGGAMDCNAATISCSIDLELNGANQVWTSSTSGDMDLTLDGSATYVGCTTKSGDVDLNVPEDMGFTMTYSTVSGDMESGLPLARSGDTYSHGSGGPCVIEIQTTSGDVELEAQ